MHNTGGSGAATDHSIVTMEYTRAKIIVQAQYICHLEFSSVHCVVLFSIIHSFADQSKKKYMFSTPLLCTADAGN